jgi:Antitoxin Phd_YefM, type II toxin-antitoxin system
MVAVFIGPSQSPNNSPPAPVSDRAGRPCSSRNALGLKTMLSSLNGSSLEARATSQEAEGLSRPQKRVPFARFRQELSDHVNEVLYTKKPLGILRHHKLVAVIVPPEMYKTLDDMTHRTISEDS